MNKKGLLAVSAAAVLVVPLIGCTPAANPNKMGDNQRGRILNNQSNVQNYTSRPDIAQRIMTAVPGISSAVVLVRNNTAYVAVNEGTLRRNTRDTNQTPSNLPEDMKQRIDQAVRQVDNSITNVYASNSPILMSRFNTFNDNRMGARTRADVNDLADVIRRIFPTAR